LILFSIEQIAFIHCSVAAVFREQSHCIQVLWWASKLLQLATYLGLHRVIISKNQKFMKEYMFYHLVKSHDFLSFEPKFKKKSKAERVY
jgi:hypothetical protein